jgi:hypothetical protein
MMRNGLITVVLLVGMTLSLNAQTQTEEEAPTEISFERSISQTSVWAGDRVHYLITLTVGPDVQIAMGDFDEVNVSFEPFFLMELVHSEEVVGEQVRHVFDYHFGELRNRRQDSGNSWSDLSLRNAWANGSERSHYQRNADPPIANVGTKHPEPAAQ